jgi:hypothetical protein
MIRIKLKNGIAACRRNFLRHIRLDVTEILGHTATPGGVVRSRIPAAGLVHLMTISAINCTSLEMVIYIDLWVARSVISNTT